MNYNTIIPVLEKEVLFSPFDNASYLVSQEKYNYEININKSTYLILQLIDGRKNLQEIKESYNKNNKEPITVEVLYHLLYTKFSKYGIIQNENIVVKPMSRANYLKLSKIIIPESLTNKVSTAFIFLYRPLIFKLAILLLCLLFTAIGINYYPDFVTMTGNLANINLWYLAFFFPFALIFHEFGHAAAAKFYGINSKGIGFGFYVFTPVFFTDITKAWRLNNKQRVLVDFGGIYFQLIFVAFILLAFLFNHNLNLLTAAFFIFLSTLYNLNPFLRTDGYWIISDSLKISNLREQSNGRLKMLFQKSEKQFSKKDWFLSIYSVISVSMIILFIISILIYDSNSIIYFPFNLIHFIQNIRSGAINDWSLKYLSTLTLPLLFYWLLVSVTVKTIKNVIKTKNG